MPYTLQFGLGLLATSLSSFAFLITMSSYLELVIRIVLFAVGFAALLATYFAFEHHFDRKGMLPPKE